MSKTVEKVTDQELVEKWHSLKKRCIEKELKFKLSLTAIRNIMRSKRCFFTKMPIQRGSTLTFDRIDARLGYVAGNVVACHIEFNASKAIFEHPQKEITCKQMVAGFAKVQKLLKANDKPLLAAFTKAYGYTIGDIVTHKKQKAQTGGMKVLEFCRQGMKLSGVLGVVDPANYKFNG
jgi:hypothetical protein